MGYNLASASDANARVISPAGTPRRARRAAWPDHIFIKAFEPEGSDLALRGPIALLASGKFGTADAFGPTSSISRLTMPRAGRPVNTLVIIVSSSVA